MANERKQVQFQEAPGDEKLLVVFNKGAGDRTRQRKLSRAASRMSMGSIKLQTGEDVEGRDPDESVVSLMKKSFIEIIPV